MRYDYQPGSGIPNPMSLEAWAAMPLKDQANFIKLGGTLFDDVKEDPKAAETITGANGRTITRGELDAMSLTQQSGFFLGHDGRLPNEIEGQIQ